MSANPPDDRASRAVTAPCDPRDEYPYGLPEHLHQIPRNRFQWDYPTAWLFGTRLIKSLGDIVVSALFKFDPRDWMTPGDPVDLHDAIEPGTSHEPAGGWIDFIADTGDSPRLVYELAYLLQQRALDVVDCGGTPRRLPRGRALVVGGDTAYPISTRLRLVERLRAPFIWARRQLELDGGNRVAPRDQTIPIVGVPGNHDYYNMLHGFQCQFRVAPCECPPEQPARTDAAGRGDGRCPVHGRPRHTGNPEDPHAMRLDIPGYSAAQHASYCALKLPYEWQLWALDLERHADQRDHGLDERQRVYFAGLAHDLARAGDAPKRIVVTSRPAFAYHGFTRHAGEVAKALTLVGLDPAFLRDGVLGDPRELRLDLSGDDHIYERYWGTTAAPSRDRPARAALAADAYTIEDTTPRGNEMIAHDPVPERATYAATVAGLGGAFHHPSQIRLGSLAPRFSWPPCDESARRISERLLRPRRILQAGAVGVIGALVAMLCFVLGRLEDSPHLLDIPLAHPSSDEMWSSLRNLWRVAATVLSIGAFGTLGWLTIRWMKRWTRPIRGDGPVASRWTRATHKVSHHPVVFWCLRWIGGSRRNTWVTLLTLPASLAFAIVIAAVGYALYACPHLGLPGDGYSPLYVVLVLLVLIMDVLAVAIGAKPFRRGKHSEIVDDALRHPMKHREKALVRAVAAHAALAVFGALIAVLVVWTPYAWTRLVLQHLAWLVPLAAYPVIRWFVEASRLVTWRTWRRRIGSCVALAGVIAWAVVVPMCHVAGSATDKPAWVGVALALVLGAYFSCLWLGWYFFVCLQWNAHGNEAGSTARVVKFAQFLRIKLTPNAAEVFAIAPQEVLSPPGKRMLKPLLVDHFVIRRPPRP